jgi:hypothetical protein
MQVRKVLTFDFAIHIFLSQKFWTFYIGNFVPWAYWKTKVSTPNTTFTTDLVGISEQISCLIITCLSLTIFSFTVCLFYLVHSLNKINLSVSLFMFSSSVIFQTDNEQSFLHIYITLPTFGSVLDNVTWPRISSSITFSLPFWNCLSHINTYVLHTVPSPYTCKMLHMPGVLFTILLKILFWFSEQFIAHVSDKQKKHCVDKIFIATTKQTES